MLVLGIDPGSHSTGFAFLLNKSTSKDPKVLEYGTIKAPRRAELPLRLKYICHELEQRIGVYKPQHLAMEESFFAKNPRTALVLGHARGAIMATALRYDIEIAEYSPSSIKKAVTGNGGASKEMVAKMVKLLLNLREIDDSTDATDALAIALAFLHNQREKPKLADTISPEILKLLARSKGRHRR